MPIIHEVKHGRKKGEKTYKRVPARYEEAVKKIAEDIQMRKKLGEKARITKQYVQDEIKEELMRRKIVQIEERAEFAAGKILNEMLKKGERITPLNVHKKIEDYRKSFQTPHYLRK